MQKPHRGPRYPLVGLARTKRSIMTYFSNQARGSWTTMIAKIKLNWRPHRTVKRKVKEGTWVLLAHVNQAS